MSLPDPAPNQGRGADCLQRPVRRSSSCSIPIADGKDAEGILGSTAYLNPKGRGDKRLLDEAEHGGKTLTPWLGETHVTR